jgi:hypothetical protein
MFCPMCGAPNEDDGVFCGNCGAALNPDEAPPLEAMAEDVEAAGEEAEAENESTETIEAAVAEPVDDEVVPPPPEDLPVPPPPPPSAPAPVEAPTPTSGLAIASLVLGIGGLTILPLLGSIVALILGYMARNEIRQRPDELTGDGLAIAGIVMGWIAVGLAVVGLLAGGGIAICAMCSVFGAGGY